MKKTLTVILTFIFTLSFVSCESPKRAAEFVKRTQNQNQQWILDHFEENEETFNKLIDVFLLYSDELYNYEGYYHIDLGYNYNYNNGYNYYQIYTHKIDNNNVNKEERKDFFESSLSSNISEEELSKILLSEKDIRNNRVKLFTKKYSTVFFSSEHINEIRFSYYSDMIYLVYCIDGETEPVMELDGIILAKEIYRINSNWYILYYYQMPI